MDREASAPYPSPARKLIIKVSTRYSRCDIGVPLNEATDNFQNFHMGLLTASAISHSHGYGFQSFDKLDSRQISSHIYNCNPGVMIVIKISKLHVSSSHKFSVSCFRFSSNSGPRATLQKMLVVRMDVGRESGVNV